MTIPVIKVKIFPKPVLKGKMDVRFPANVKAIEFLTIANANGSYTFGADYTLLDASPVTDPTTAIVAVYDQSSQSWKVQSLSELLASTAQIEQHIAAAGPVTIENNAGLVRVDQAVGAAITLDMPLASDKTCPVLIADWKGDASTHNITISLQGADKFPGGLTSWTIAADTGSLRLSPIPGVGYVIG